VYLTVNIIPPQINSSLTVRAIVDLPWSYTITSNGTQPIVLGASSLPAGLTYANGVISGTITTAGTYFVTLTAQGPLSSDTRTLVIYAGIAEPLSSGFPDPYHMQNAVGSVTLNFAKANDDKISFRGSLPVPGDFSSNGQTVSIDFGGVTVSGKLDKSGKFISADRTTSFKLNSRRTTNSGRNAQFNFKYHKNAASQLADEGLTNDTIAQYCNINVIVSLIEAKLSFDSSLTVFYSADKGVKGTAKGVPDSKLPK
jgi:hypothetical protein